MNKDIKRGALMLATRMRELAEDIEYEVGKMGENADAEWAAMAVGVTWLDRREEKPCTLVPLQSRKESTASSQGAKAAPSPLTPSV